MNHQALCIFCNLPVAESNGNIYGNSPWEGKDFSSGSHWSCENKADEDSEMMQFADLAEVESKYRGPGMW